MVLCQERLLYVNIMDVRLKIKADSAKVFFFDTFKNSFASSREFNLLAKCTKQHKFESLSDFSTYSRTYLVARYSDSFVYLFFFWNYFEKHIVIHGGYSISTSAAINIYTWKHHFFHIHFVPYNFPSCNNSNKVYFNINKTNVYSKYDNFFLIFINTWSCLRKRNIERQFISLIVRYFIRKIYGITLSVSK